MGGYGAAARAAASVRGRFHRRVFPTAPPHRPSNLNASGGVCLFSTSPLLGETRVQRGPPRPSAAPTPHGPHGYPTSGGSAQASRPASPYSVRRPSPPPPPAPTHVLFFKWPTVKAEALPTLAGPTPAPARSPPVPLTLTPPLPPVQCTHGSTLHAHTHPAYSRLMYSRLM